MIGALTASLRLFALLAVFAVLAITPRADADKIHLQDGRVLEGEVQREIDGGVYFVVRIGSIEQVQLFTSDQIIKIERDEDNSKQAADESESGSTDQAATKADPERGSATRIAVLNFGPPSSWQGEIGDTVGIQISVKAFEDVIPMLEEDGVDVVVIRINSGGGLTLEMPKFQDLFHEEYKPRFRTVAWVESAISAAAMSPWVIEEFYMMTEGNIGGCTEFRGPGVASKGFRLEEILFQMEKASEKADRNPLIMRAMQIRSPLSYDKDPDTGAVTWYPDETGRHVVNPRGRVLVLNSREAVHSGFARGIADTVEELAEAMELEEWELAGERATEYIDKSMRRNHRADTRWQLVWVKYAEAAQIAAQTQDKDIRSQQVGVARRHLRTLRSMIRENPNFELMYIPDDWFDEQEELLRELLK